ncbi:hypothetical protein RSAG8_08074, partial [Rhizoctonia solani AG-8 WAC10335]
MHFPWTLPDALPIALISDKALLHRRYVERTISIHVVSMCGPLKQFLGVNDTRAWGEAHAS